MLTYKTIIKTSFILLIVLSALNLISANILSTKGLAVAIQEKEVLRLEKENRQIKTKIEEASRLSDVESLSHSLGFVRSGQVVYLQTSAGFALK
ncbi:hypothetical protein A2572_01340 [Candidatus Collierbacteria bacterium RIFOXYD1_FULL_40_9]|uniref:Cell division protein FtsL n=1 Tax=Candidatus Collierbacteria bacterium RIFOXYD1_FULL_40_9 TaxID=1817731 RepID=A0A1F5FVL2_9BACT|nr:MAG: hypothetical protein A2572_01340 [Candidatus Collierbacteria bacterium RIFOXYD1_FULL_40_9]